MLCMKQRDNSALPFGGNGKKGKEEKRERVKHNKMAKVV